MPASDAKAPTSTADARTERCAAADGGGGVEGTHVGLVSGGLDSTIAAHAAVRWGPVEVLVYLDTTTGAAANRRYVERVADRLGVQLWTLRTGESYGDLVREHDFPGPATHQIMYNRLKGRQLGKLAALCEGDLHCWTGIRAQESQRRMDFVEPTRERGEGRWTWHAPIHDWSRRRCWVYRDRFQLPVNRLWFTLGRSADCFCGAYGAPAELIDAEAAGCERLVAKLRALEDEVEPDPDVAERGRWGWAAMSDVDQRAERGKRRDMTLCAACEPPPGEQSDD